MRTLWQSVRKWRKIYRSPFKVPRRGLKLHAKKSLPVYLYINLLFQIIASLRGRSALDNFSHYGNYRLRLRYHTGEFGYYFLAWNEK